MKTGGASRGKRAYKCGQCSANGGIKAGRVAGEDRERRTLIFRNRRIYVGELADAGTKAVGVVFPCLEIGARSVLANALFRASSGKLNLPRLPTDRRAVPIHSPTCFLLNLQECNVSAFPHRCEYSDDEHSQANDS